MSEPAIEIEGLIHRYGKSDAVNGLTLRVEPGECYGFFGRNGAGKTTTIKCLLNLLKPSGGRVRVLGLDPQKDEARVKARLAYVPDFVAFYPWMSVGEVLDYQASFREKWNLDTQRALLERFQLDLKQPSTGLSKGQRTQLALIGAMAAEPDLLVLDEPTSGLDPLVRREFIQTVIGAYQKEAPGKHTVFVSTHLISEFEGLIDRFTVIEKGRGIVTMGADEARAKYRKVRARFEGTPPAASEFKEAKSARAQGRQIELIVNGNGDQMIARLRAMNALELTSESLSLEEVFLASVG